MAGIVVGSKVAENRKEDNSKWLSLVLALAIDQDQGFRTPSVTDNFL